MTLDLLADLNEPQRRAVMHTDGPLLVLAGAGSGKTRVITRRVAYLIHGGVPPHQVLAITFTNKAAGEMRSRISALGVPPGSTVGTFHAVCARLLREFAAEALLPRDFVIYDADDQLACVKQAMKRLEIPAANFSPGAVHSAISRGKNALLDPPGYARKHSDYFGGVVARVYEEYQRILQGNRALDFDDLLLRTAWLMRDRLDVRELLGRRWRYVLVDEYQDTNHAQYVIAHGIALGHENIAVTGDPDQSIYAWRGADISNILEFEQDYPNAVVVRLENNYRSTASILAAADRLIAHNRQRKRKSLLPTRPDGCQVQVVRLDDEQAEARHVAALAQQLRTQDGRPWRDLAVFYRVNALSRVLEAAFRREGIPYQIARGVEFYSRKEIKDVLAYLRLMADAHDDVSCRRIINVPARGIGATTVRRLEQSAEKRGLGLLEACADPSAAGKVLGFARLMTELAGGQYGSVRDVLATVLARTGLDDLLGGSEETRQAQRNAQELVSSAAEFDQDSPGATLADYLAHVSLVSDVDVLDSQAGAVTFMTLHAAKGLEFPVVVMVGCEQGLLPFARADEQQARDVEEERRLAFVGMTRAMDRLVMTYVRKRLLRGAPTRQSASPFLGQIGQGAVQRIDLAGPDEPRRRPAMDLEEFQRFQQASRNGFAGDRGERAAAEAVEQADLLPEQFSGIRPGRRVRHATFGGGWVVAVRGTGQNARAVIDFDQGGRKTLVLQYARLEPL